jgi:hypothetical protein
MSGNTRGNKRRQNNQGRPPRPPPKPMGNIIFFHRYICISYSHLIILLIGPCWFCLSSPEVEKHLVISVGEHVSS